jgi:hypothetical protein
MRGPRRIRILPLHIALLQAFRFIARDTSCGELKIATTSIPAGGFAIYFPAPFKSPMLHTNRNTKRSIGGGAH